MSTFITGEHRRQPTWIPPESAAHGRLGSAEKKTLATSAFAFPRTRKEPMTDANHVRDAMARFDQVTAVSEAERDLAFRNIQRAARHFGIAMKESNWREFGTHRR
jgi:hypothetical protein